MARSARPTASGSDYSASNSLTVLEGLDAVRKRPGMYIGSVDSRGLTHCVWEILDNAVDEALGSHATHITLTAHDDGSFSVRDNGRGIPVDIEPKSGLPGVILVMTRLHAGGKFGGDGYKVSGGLHGVGASVVNALSTRVDVTVARDGKFHTVSFRRGEPGTFHGDAPDAKFTASSKVKSAGRAKKADRGTTVRFWPDADIFLPGAAVDPEALRERCYTTAHLVPGVHITLNVNGTEETFHTPDGLAALVEDKAGESLVAPVNAFSGSGSFTAAAQVLEDGKLVTRDVEKQIDVDIALAWGQESFAYTPLAFANVVATPGGGTHLTGVEKALTKAVQNAVASTTLLKASDPAVTRDDVLEGLTLAVAVRLPEPEFEGQTKEILSTPAATKVVADVVTAEIHRVFGANRLKPTGRAICTKIVNAAKARQAARDRRDAARKARAVSSGPLPSKLRDCRFHDENAELFLVEGDSAAGSVAGARDASRQAFLPLKGKILNVERASEKAMLANEECSAIVAALGGGIGANFDPDRVRYGKLILLVDADVDGSHIRALILTLLHRYMPALITSGRVVAAQPPLYRITSTRGDHTYCFSDGERDQLVRKLGDSKVAHIMRFKGLGEMSVDQLAETAIDRATRRERIISMSDAAQAAGTFDRLMGGDASARRTWLFDAAAAADLDDLDV